MSVVKVSVIMSVYNDELYVSDAVKSILNQTYEDFEFIIINDGSTDNSFEILNNYANEDDRIILINQDNMGLTKSLNKAIALSKNNFIARMDSDDISLPNRLEKQVVFLKENTEYALVGTNVIKIDTVGGVIEINKTKYKDSDIRKTFRTRNCIAHGSVMLNKSLCGNILKYDETFKYAQDYRLWADVSLMYKVANLKESLYQLRIHIQSISKNKVEEQSKYAGIVAYEYDTKSKIINYLEEIENNSLLRRKIGMILLLNMESKLARKYFTSIHPFYYMTFLLEYIDIKKIKKWFK